MSQQVPRYVLKSSKAIQGRELCCCSGNKCSARSGFSTYVVHQNGAVVKSGEGQVDISTEQKNSTPKVLAISLSHNVQLGPQQTRVAQLNKCLC